MAQLQVRARGTERGSLRQEQEQPPALGGRHPSSHQQWHAMPESRVVCLPPGMTAQAQLPLGTPPITGKTQ